MIMGIIGNIGEGKTALSVAIAQVQKYRNPSLNVLANFTIKKPLGNGTAITLEEFLSLKYEENRKLVILDEPYAWGIDSRRSSSDINLLMSEKILQSRKYNMDILYVVQLPSSIDLRLKRLTTAFFFAFHSNEKRFKYAYFGKTQNCLRLIDRELFEKFVFPFYNHMEIVSVSTNFNNNEEKVNTEQEVLIEN